MSGPVAILAGRGLRQDAGDQPAGGVRDRDRGRAGRTRCSSSRSRTRPRARWSSGCGGLGLPRRHGADVPRPRAVPAALLLAAPARRGAAAGAAGLEGADPRPARAPAAGPLPVHAGQGPRRRDRVGEVAPGHAARTTSRRPRRPAASRRSRPTCSCARSTDYERAKVRAGRIDFDDLLVGHGRPARGRRRGRRDGPGAQALVQRRRVPGHEPAPAAAARAVARRVARPVRRRATRTRRSTRSPARRRRS